MLSSGPQIDPVLSVVCERFSAISRHSLSQQGVGRHSDTQTLKDHPSGHTKMFVLNFLKSQFQAYNCFIHFNLSMIHITLYRDIMQHFIIKKIHVYGYNLSILWFPLKNRTPKKLAIANFRHPVFRFCL